MRKFITLLFLGMILIVNDLDAARYKILRLSSKTIIIGGKECTIGSFFNDDEQIKWTEERQYMYAQNQTDNQTYYFSNVAMSSKNCRTARSYVSYLSPMSTRDGAAWQPLEGKNKKNFTEKRIALVIGNSNYLNNTRLKNSIPDAESVSEALQELGFDVMCLYDGTRKNMEEAVESFQKKAVDEKYRLALFYYVGHGVQFNQKSYLIPVDAKLSSKSDLNNCMDYTWLLPKIQDTECENVIVILDACRNEKLNWTRSTDMSTLATVEPPKGMCFATSTSSGDFAQDIVKEEDENGPYAKALVAAMQKKSMTVDDIFRDVKAQVMQYTDYTQIPTWNNKILNIRLVLNGKNEYANSLDDVDDLTLAQNGDMEAQYRIGLAHEFGIDGYTRSDDEAVEWYVRAAKQGHKEAMNKLGYVYFRLQDYAKARSWFLKAAEAGNVNAQYNIAMLSLDKKYGCENKKEGIKWLTKAAEAGNAEAQTELGKCYYVGYAVTPYLTEAVKWFDKAAEQNDEEACYYMGLCCMHGDGTEQDPGKAIEYFRKAAEKGYADAQYQMCDCYSKGVGVERNIEQAKMWCDRAALQGHEKALRKLPTLFGTNRNDD